MKKHLFLLFIFTNSVIFSQIKMTGKVTDSIGTPLELANIILINSESNSLETFAMSSFGVDHVKYKNFTLGWQLSHTAGGDIVAKTVATLLGRGGIVEDRKNTFVLPGVRQDGTPNTLQINNSTYYFSNVLFGPLELNVYDGSVVRLQELSLSYAFPQKFLDKTPLIGAEVECYWSKKI